MIEKVLSEGDMDMGYLERRWSGASCLGEAGRSSRRSLTGKIWPLSISCSLGSSMYSTYLLKTSHSDPGTQWSIIPMKVYGRSVFRYSIYVC